MEFFLEKIEEYLGDKFRSWDEVDEAIICSILDVCKNDKEYSKQKYFLDSNLFRIMIESLNNKKYLKKIRDTFYYLVDSCAIISSDIDSVMRDKVPEVFVKRNLTKRIYEVFDKLLNSKLIDDMFSYIKKDIINYIEIEKVKLEKEKLQLNELRKIVIKFQN